jgi:hypothetical protein
VLRPTITATTEYISSVEEGRSSKFVSALCVRSRIRETTPRQREKRLPSIVL